MTFTNFTKPKDSQTVYGQTDTGQWVAFENNDQFIQSGGDPSKIQITDTAPQATNYSQYVLTANDAPPSGVDPALWGQLTPADKSFVMALNQQAKNTYLQGMANYSINSQNMQDALKLAQNDPTILATYGDQAKTALSDLNNNLGYISAEYAQQTGLTSAEQAQAQKDLASQEAAAGRAQSGFRQQAQNLLTQQQQGVIQSSQRQMQQQVRQLGSQYETQFGSAATPPISTGGFNYQPYGGITGSQVTGKQQAVEAKQQQIASTTANPLITQ